MKIKAVWRLLMIVAIVLLQFLILVVSVNNLAALKKQSGTLEMKKVEASKQTDNNYDQIIKDMKKDLQYRAEKDGLLKIRYTDYTDKQAIILTPQEVDQNSEAITNSNLSIIP